MSDFSFIPMTPSGGRSGHGDPVTPSGGRSGHGDPVTPSGGRSGHGDPVTPSGGRSGHGDPVTPSGGRSGHGDPVTPSGGRSGHGDPAPPEQPPPRGAEPERPAAPAGNARRTIAVAIAAVGALLMGAAATTFVSVRWEQLALLGKTGVVGTLALLAVALGIGVKDKLPGAGAVLTHLGGFLLPIDLGALAVALGANRAEAALVGGFSAVTLLEILDTKKSSIAMALGRVAGVVGACVGAAAIAELHPGVGLLLAAAALALVRRKWEPLLLSVIATSSFLVELAGEIVQPGSLISWVAELVIIPDWQAVALGLVALGVILWADRKQPGMIAASMVAALTAPAFIRLTEDRLTLLVALIAAAMLGARFVSIAAAEKQFHRFLDEGTLVLLAVSALMVWNEIVAAIEAGDSLPNLVVTGSMLLAGLLLGDAHHAYADRDVRILRNGREGNVIVTVSAAASVALMLVSLADPLIGAAILAAFGTLLAATRRPFAAEFSVVALAGAPALGYEHAESILGFGLLAATVLHARVLWRLRNGSSPRDAGTVQTIGIMIAAATLVVAAFMGAPAYPAAAAIFLVAALMAWSSSTLATVPDVLTAPRLLLLLAPLPLVFENLFGAAIFTFGIALVLLLDAEVFKTPVSDFGTAAAVTVGAWMLAADMGWDVVTAYSWGPGVAMLYLAWRALRLAPQLSSALLLPGLLLLTGVPLTERGFGATGWLAIVGGVAAILSLVWGGSQKLRVPFAVGMIGVLAMTGIEVAAFVPMVPVWALLAAGGVALFIAGAALERQAGSETAATLKAAWGELR